VVSPRCRSPGAWAGVGLGALPPGLEVGLHLVGPVLGPAVPGVGTRAFRARDLGGSPAPIQPVVVGRSP
jgi:hypothetical protein